MIRNQEEITKVKFSEEDLRWFSSASGDLNPLHMDEGYSRKTAYGQRVVFGILGVLACFRKLHLKNIRFKQFDIEFQNPIFLTIEYDVCVVSKTDKIILELRDGTKVLVRIKALTNEDRPTQSTSNANKKSDSGYAPVNLNSAALDYTERELLKKIRVNGLYPIEGGLGALQQSEMAPDSLHPLQIRILMACSYLVGMELPGKRAFLSKLTLNFAKTSSEFVSFSYQANTGHYDQNYGLLDVDAQFLIEEEIVARAKIKAFARKKIPLIPLSRIKNQLSPSSKISERKVALVTGGSRGLGAVLVKALALQGYHVVINYFKSKQEAELLQQELKSVGENVSLMEGDIGDTAWCEKAKKRILREFKRLDLLICNASQPPIAMDESPATSQRMENYVASNVELIKTPLRLFLDELEKNQGICVGISSMFVETEPKGFSHYVRLKRDVEALIRRASQSHPKVSYLVVRPPKLLTDMSNTPMGTIDALPPEIVATETANTLTTLVAGELRLINQFSKNRAATDHGLKSIQTTENHSGKIVVAGSFTVEPLLLSLNYWREKLRLPVTVKIAPYHQIFQELLYPESSFRLNTEGLNVILFRMEDWIQEDGKSVVKKVTEDDKQRFSKVTTDYIEALGSYSQKNGCPILLIICPPSQIVYQTSQWQALFDELAQTLCKAVERLQGIEILKAEDWHIKYKVANFLDPMREELGKIPYLPKYFHVLGTLIMRRYYAFIQRPHKVIVVDCDNTLWEGICGEVGPKGVTVSKRFKSFQNFLIGQLKKGFLLCLCSKNSEADVWDVFEQHPDMLLKKEHIVETQINWNPKSTNIQKLAASLNVGLDSLIFIDDNPVECAEVRANCQEALTLCFPEGEEKVEQLLNHLWAFDRHAMTAEDRKRTQLYQDNKQRQNLAESTNCFEDFIKSLNLKVEIQPLTPETLTRSSQLTYRTNQFNFTGKRRASQEIAKLTEKQAYHCLTVDVSDRFGSYGLVGVIVYRLLKDYLEVDTFLLSCRVLGRGVEFEMLNKLGCIAQKHHLQNVLIPFTPTAKNESALQFLEQIKQQLKENKDRVGMYMFSANFLEHLSFSFGKPASQNTSKKQIKPTQTRDVQETFPSKREIEQELVHVIDISSSLERLHQAIEKETPSTLFGLTKREQKDQAPSAMELSADAGQLKKEIIELFAQALSMQPEEIALEEELENYGLGSYAIINIMVELSKTFNDLPSTFLFEHRTLQSIVDYLLENDPSTGARVAEVDVPQKNKEGLNDDDIAIIGVHGRYPNSPDLQTLWEHLKRGNTCITRVPKERWDVEDFDDSSGNQKDKSYCQWGGFLEDVDQFDAGFFNIAPKEAELMDPQQRLFLEVVWGLLEDAGHTRNSLDKATGVFVGVISGDYNVYESQAALKGNSFYRFSDYYQIANRISYFLDIEGPSLAIDTACSSSGTALHLACQSIKRKECGTAIVGGVNLILHPSRLIQYSRMQMLSSDSRCKPFGDEADGTLLGEGIGAILIKSLKEAEADGDQIYGVIKSTAINAGGKTNGFTVPNPQAQAKLIQTALQRAAIDPRTISYVETHGTGTSLGDPIEIRGLTLAFAAEQKEDHGHDRQYCPIGSIKSNIGHLESCAAIAGISKILLQMKNKTLVPSLNAKKSNPKIAFEKTPFYVLQNEREWSRPVIDGKVYPLRAGLSSFGAGGANVHVIIEEYLQKPACRSEASEARRLKTGNGKTEYGNGKMGQEPYLIVLSAKNENRLREVAKNLHHYLTVNGEPCLSAGASSSAQTAVDRLAKEGTPNLSDLAYTLQVGREAMAFRLAAVVETKTELREKLSEFLARKKQIQNVYVGKVKADKVKKKNQESFRNRDIDSLTLLARRWVEGVEIDGALLYQNERRKRISLPTYPFKKETFWILDEAGRRYGCVAADGEVSKRKAHLFLGDRMTSPFLKGCMYGSDFNLKRLPYLEDHRIYGDVVVPASLYLSFALSSAMKEFGGEVHHFTSLTFNKALLIEEETSFHVQFHVTPLPDKKMELTLVSQKEEGGESDKEKWQTHFSGKYEVEDSNVRNQKLPIENLKKKCEEVWLPKDFYRDSREIGFEWGPKFQCIEELYRRDGEALARVVLPEELERDLSTYSIHPAFLDACFQVFVASMGRQSEQKATREAYLPLGIDEVHFYRKPTTTSWSYVKTVEKSGKETLVVDIVLCGESGEVTAKFLGMRLKRARQATLRQMGQAQSVTPDDWFYQLQWEEQDQVHQASDGVTQVDRYPYLLLADKKEDVLWLENKFKSANRACQIMDHDRIINSAQSQGIVYLMEPLVWENDDHAFETIQKHLQKNIILILEFIKSILRNHSFPVPKIWLITQHSQMPEEETPNFTGTLLKGSLWGLGRVLFLEHPELWGGMIDIAGKSENGQAIQLVREITSPAGEDHIVLRDKRYVLRLKPSNVKPEQNSPIVHQQASYLVTGAFGGIGLKLMQWLVEQGAKTLVLMGRMKPSPQVQSALEIIKKQGVDVRIYQSDVSNQQEVDYIVQEIADHLPPLRGLFHLAGVVNDSALLNQNWERFEEVMGPKVGGAWHLHQATRGLSLDFFVMFSSASAVLGARGQGNYAVANAFLDELARYRREKQLPALSISWGPWAGTGMSASLNPTVSQNTFSTEAFGAIQPDEGFSCLKRLMLGKHTTIAVLPYRWKEIYQNVSTDSLPSLLKGLHQFEWAKKEAEKEKSHVLDHLQSAASNEQRPILKRYVREQIANLLGYKNSEQLAIGQSFQEMGFDSLTAVDLRNRIGKDLNATLPATLIFDYPALEDLTEYLMRDVLKLENEREQMESTENEWKEQEKDNDDISMLEDSEVEALIEKELQMIESIT